MQRNSLRGFIFFGTAFRYLQELKPHGDVRSVGGPLENIDFILDFLRNNNMTVSINASYALLALQAQLTERAPGESAIDQEFCNYLQSVMNELRPTVIAESQEVTAFFPRSC